MGTKLERWQIKVKCAICKSIIYSKWEGQFVECPCGAIFVDQTPYYARYGGHKCNFIIPGEYPYTKYLTREEVYEMLLEATTKMTPEAVEIYHKYHAKDFINACTVLSLLEDEMEEA